MENFPIQSLIVYTYTAEQVVLEVEGDITLLLEHAEGLDAGVRIELA